MINVPPVSSHDTFNRGQRRTTLWLLLAILILATGLRLLHISHQSFWLDEVETVNTVRRAIPSLTMSGTTPPLYYIIVSYWMRLVPETEAMLRLPSVLFGIGAVALLFLLGRRLLGSRAGLIAALLMAVSPFHIHYSQEARAYSLMVLLTLLSWLALIRVLDREVTAAVCGLGRHHGPAAPQPQLCRLPGGCPGGVRAGLGASPRNPTLPLAGGHRSAVIALAALDQGAVDHGGTTAQRRILDPAGGTR